MHHLFLVTVRPHPSLSHSGSCDHARLLGAAALCTNRQKKTLPPLNFSLQPAALFLWHRSGSWLTPTRGDPDCHVTERSWLGKRDRAISRARSINWGAAGPAAGWIRRLSRRNAFPLPAQRSTLKAHDSRCMDGGVSEVIALPRAMRCSREGRPGTDKQVVGTGRKTRGFSRRLEFETRSDAHAPPKRGARCR